MGGFVAVETLLITGATGFVGSHLVEACRGHDLQVRALVRRPADVSRLESRGLTCLRGSLEDPEALRAALEGVDTVIHLAAATRARSAAEYQRANVAGTQAVIETMLAAARRPKRLIYLSSLAAAGPSQDGRPVTRDDSPRPLTTYGRTKLAGEKVCGAVADEFQVAILRAPGVYGPRDRDIYRFFRLAQAGFVPLPSGPTRRLQLIHAADLARALLMAATSDRARGVYHVADAQAYTWEELAQMVATAVGGQARVIRLPAALVSAAAAVSETAAGLIGRSTIFNREKARELLAPGWLCETELALRDFGFKTHIALPDGLAQTAAWYREQGWL